MKIFEKIKNIFKKSNNKTLTIEQLKVKAFVENIRENYKGIIKEVVQEECPNISSFNFTKSAFYDKKWDNIVCKARGLFIDTVNWKVVARGFDKFFNVEEREETQYRNLLANSYLKGDINVYKKYNGYLGIFSITDDFSIFAQKSRLTMGQPIERPEKSDNSWYAKNFAYMCKDMPWPVYDVIKKFCKAENCSALFEVIDYDNDPHIIASPSKLVLLTFIRNSLEFEEVKTFKFDKAIELIKEDSIVSFAENVKMVKWYEPLNITKDIYEIDGFSDETINIFNNTLKPIEGVVLVDEIGNRVKIKSEYYNFWKYIRGVYQRYNKMMKEILSTPNTHDKLVINCYEAIKNNKYCDEVNGLFNNCPKSYMIYKYKRYMIESIKKEFMESIVNSANINEYINFINASHFRNFISFKNYIISRYSYADLKHNKYDVPLTDFTVGDIILNRNEKELINYHIKRH